MKFADLHLHTIFSDGTCTPSELLLACEKAGLSCIAVTDHDNTSAIAPILEAAADSQIEVLPGIELSCEYNGQEIHILGYLIDYRNPDLSRKLKELKNIRIRRVYQIADKLKELGMNLDPQSVFKISGTGTVGRLHIARAMEKAGLVRDVREAFQKYIGDKCPAYVLGFKLSPAAAIKLITEAGGIAILAHPYLIENDELIMDFLGMGLMGLEVYYPEHSQGMINFYLEIAKKHNLLITGGSDCHGLAKPQVRVGSIKIPYELVERLKEAKGKL
jgi:predicted metal-dependent phosphoesterase TrpH